MTGWKKLPNAKPIVNITIDEELLKRVENYRFLTRQANRSQTICYLVEEGFKALESKANSEPQYVSFDEAIKALTEGTEVNFIAKNNYTYRILPKQNFNALRNDGIVWEELLEGKWIIKK